MLWPEHGACRFLTQTLITVSPFWPPVLTQAGGIRSHKEMAKAKLWTLKQVTEKFDHAIAAIRNVHGKGSKEEQGATMFYQRFVEEKRK